MYACVYYGHHNVFTKKKREENERKHFTASFPEQINMNFVPCKQKAQEIIYLNLFLKGTKRGIETCFVNI